MHNLQVKGDRKYITVHVYSNYTVSIKLKSFTVQNSPPLYIHSNKSIEYSTLSSSLFNSCNANSISSHFFSLEFCRVFMYVRHFSTSVHLKNLNEFISYVCVCLCACATIKASIISILTIYSFHFNGGVGRHIMSTRKRTTCMRSQCMFFAANSLCIQIK